MEFFTKIIQWVQQVPAKEMRRYMYVLIAGTSISMMVIIFIVYEQSNHLVAQLKKINDIAKSAGPLFRNYEKIQQEEVRIQGMLEKNQNEDMRSFIELFCKNQRITPQPDLSPVSIDINEKFEEIAVQVTLMGQSTQKLVEILDALKKEALTKEKILYTKNIHIKKDPNGNTINIDLTIATIRMKKEGIS